MLASSRSPRRPANLALVVLAGAFLTAGRAHAQAEPEQPAPAPAPAPEQAAQADPMDADVGEKTVPADQVSPGEVVSQEGGSTVAAKSDVHPIVPEPGETPARAYQLYWELDLPVLAVALVLGGARMIRTSEGSAEPHCIENLDPGETACDDSELNALDRTVAGRYSEGWAQASDIGLLVLGASPVFVLWPDGGFVNMLNDAVVVYQSALLAVAFSGLSSLNTGRGRPYVYGDEASDETKRSPEASLSYFSGHTAFAFAMSTSMFWTVNRRHPGSAFSWTTLAVGTAAASFVGTARVMAGRHFPTDVLAGAAVGAGMGTLIPALHASPVVVTRTPAGDGAMLNWISAM